MNKKNAYEYGKENGYGIARENINEPDVDLSNDEGRDKFISEMCETETEHFRQFTPFEFFAKECNEARNPNGLWDAYDRGVQTGIRKAMRETRHA
jgi:hypothetical protein